MEMFPKSTVLMTWPKAFNRVLWRAKLKGVTSLPMMRSTEYKAVSAESVLLSVVVLTVFWTVNGGGTLMVGVGVGAVVAAGVLTVGVAATAAVATGTAESVVASAVATGTAESVVASAAVATGTDEAVFVSVANAAAEQS
jgi:hypothetical protein